jgi:hypothetical protein
MVCWMGAAMRLNSLRISLMVSGISPDSDSFSAPFFRGVSGDDEEGRGGHGQGDVPIPCFVSADLVMVEPGFVFGGLEAFLDGPSASGYAHQLGQVGVGWSVTKVVGDVVGVGDRAAGEQPVPAARGCATA